jgi:uncharacterized membrane protein YeiH
MSISAQSIIYAIDLFGTASFAFSGALRAIDRKPDFVGMLMLAGATAAGGSVLRDTLLNRDVMILRDWGYPLAILVATAITFFFPRQVYRRERVLMYFDAIGLGSASAIATSTAWNTVGMNPLSVLYIAALSGCAGGIVRDLIIRKETLVLSDELYVTPMLIGAGALMITQTLGMPPTGAFITAMVVTTSVRIAAIQCNWRLPRILLLDPIQHSEQGVIHANNDEGAREAEGAGRPVDGGSARSEDRHQ